MNKERGEVLPRFKEFVEKLRQAGLDVTLGMISTGKGGHLASEPNFFKNRFDAIEEYKLRDLPVIGYKEFDEAYGWWEKTPGQHESELLDFKWKLKELDPYRLLMTDTSLCGRVYG